MKRPLTAAARVKASKRKIARMKDLVVDLAGLWGDINQYVCDRCDDLRDDLDELSNDIDAAAEQGEARL